MVLRLMCLRLSGTSTKPDGTEADGSEAAWF